MGSGAMPVTDAVIDKTRIRHAATVLLVRDRLSTPRVLMGQRGASAVFMPNKFVFPGGAVDTADAEVPLGTALHPLCAERLLFDRQGGPAPETLAVAAIRELWEETGLMLGTPGFWPTPAPADWQAFADSGHLPSAAGLDYIFRAITPPGRPRRFDARFFLVDAAHVLGDPDDFSHACEELSHLQWIPLQEARGFDLPFITEVVLAEVETLIARDGPAESVPFFDNSGTRSEFRRIA